ncbi:MAG: hypothetical protein HY791_16840 [Deltaproteobacteria bacterium]|nr:hypothetical protein [Deltaproteobacteria bacterium]
MKLAEPAGSALDRASSSPSGVETIDELAVDGAGDFSTRTEPVESVEMFDETPSIVGPGPAFEKSRTGTIELGTEDIEVADEENEALRPVVQSVPVDGQVSFASRPDRPAPESPFTVPAGLPEPSIPPSPFAVNLPEPSIPAPPSPFAVPAGLPEPSLPAPPVHRARTPSVNRGERSEPALMKPAQEPSADPHRPTEAAAKIPSSEPQRPPARKPSSDVLRPGLQKPSSDPLRPGPQKPSSDPLGSPAAPAVVAPATFVGTAPAAFGAVAPAAFGAPIRADSAPTNPLPTARTSSGVREATFPPPAYSVADPSKPEPRPRAVSGVYDEVFPPPTSLPRASSSVADPAKPASRTRLVSGVLRAPESFPPPRFPSPAEVAIAPYSSSPMPDASSFGAVLCVHCGVGYVMSGECSDCGAPSRGEYTDCAVCGRTSVLRGRCYACGARFETASLPKVPAPSRHEVSGLRPPPRLDAYSEVATAPSQFGARVSNQDSAARVSSRAREASAVARSPVAVAPMSSGGTSGIEAKTEVFPRPSPARPAAPGASGAPSQLHGSSDEWRAMPAAPPDDPRNSSAGWSARTSGEPSARSSAELPARPARSSAELPAQPGRPADEPRPHAPRPPQSVQGQAPTVEKLGVATQVKRGSIVAGRAPVRQQGAGAPPRTHRLDGAPQSNPDAPKVIVGQRISPPQRCARCGFDLPEPRPKRCPGCRAILDEPTHKKCRGCGHVNKGDLVECVRCRTPLD